MVKKSIKRLVVAGIVSVLVVANSIIAFASSHDFDGYAGSCHYSGGAYIDPNRDNGIYDAFGAYVSTSETTDLTVLGYGTYDDDMTKLWYSGGEAQTTYTSGYRYSNVSIGKNAGYVLIDAMDDAVREDYVVYR